jgi:hypothetical protein
MFVFARRHDMRRSAGVAAEAADAEAGEAGEAGEAEEAGSNGLLASQGVYEPLDLREPLGMHELLQAVRRLEQHQQQQQQQQESGQQSGSFVNFRQLLWFWQQVQNLIELQQLLLPPSPL